MPDVTHRFFSARLPFFLVLALLPCLLSNSCASSTSARKVRTEKGLSPAAETDYLFLVYQDLLREDRKDEAMATLEKLAALHPAPDLAVELANFQWGQNQRDKATDTLEKALAAFPDARQLTFYLANAYQMRRMIPEAARTLERFLAKHPKDAPAIRELASILEDAGRYQEAAAVLDRMPQADRDAMTLYLMAKASVGLGNPQAAIARMRQALQKDDSLMIVWADLAQLLEKQGDTKGAEECYRKMETMGENSMEIRAKRIRLAIARKDPAGAMKLLATSKKQKPLLLDAMSAFVEGKYPKQAKQVLAMLEAADPQSSDLLFYRAVVAYEGEHDLRAAMRFLSQVKPDNPNYDKSLGFRIQIALELDETAKARELVREARRRFPDKKEFAVVEAGIQDKLGQNEQAAATLKQALVTWPDDVDLLYRYGVSLEKRKQRAEARKVMEKIVTLDPKNPDALNYLGYSLAEEGRDLDKALTMIQTALAKEPDNPFFLDSLAWAYFKLNRIREALDTIHKAIGRDRVKDAIIWEHYGDIAVAAGRRDEAKKAYGKALELGSETPEAVAKKLEAL